jgi:K+-sensing histidine kinase KdpD
LGLALCRWIVLSHAGQITAENNAVRGATFNCVLPYATEAEPAAAVQ